MHTAPIGVLGGAFDPVHLGHLQLARDCLRQLRLGQLLLIPTGHPPHRTPPVVANKHRIAMLQQALSDMHEPRLVLDARELQRQGPAYTADTLRELRAEHPHQSLYLLLGSDAAATFSTWYRWREILRLAHLVVVQRAGTVQLVPAPQLKSRLCTDLRTLQQHPCGRILLSTALRPPAVASTQVRERLSQGDFAGAAAWLPTTTQRYILQHELYAN